MRPTERLILLHAHHDVTDNVYNFSQWNFSQRKAKNYQQIYNSMCNLSQTLTDAQTKNIELTNIYKKIAEI